MVTLEINGQRIEVDDSFRDLTPEQQQAQVDEIAAGLTPAAPAGQIDNNAPIGHFNKALTGNPIRPVGSGGPLSEGLAVYLGALVMITLRRIKNSSKLFT